MEADAAHRAEALDLLPLGSIDLGLVGRLAGRLSAQIGLPCHVLPRDEAPPASLPGRNQVDAGKWLAWLEARPATPAARLVAALTVEDLALPIFTFVFGLARQGGQACLVSVVRTDPRFQGLPGDDVLWDRRTLAELRHELGHLAGLQHCPDNVCLMNFAGSVEKVDRRGARLCAACAARAPGWLARTVGEVSA